jgi:hypothetical protein
VRIEFETTRDEVKEAAWVHWRRNPDSEKDRFQLLNLAGFGATALGLLLLTVRPDGGGRVAPIALIAIGLFIPLRQKAVMFAQNHEAWTRGERLLQPTVWEFADEIQVTSPLYDITYRWGIFIRWIEGPKVFLLYQTIDHYRVIPKRAFKSEEEIDEFRQMLIENVVPPSSGFPIRPN